MFEDAGAEQHVKVRIRERQLGTVGNGETLPMHTLAPLPAAQRRRVDSVCVVTGGREEIDGDAVAAAGVENP